ncbi:amidohydrolase [Blastococcus sp. TML/M2B]|uniref:amidohydrolase n=1 Tax=unclassified Blastococcus TaxID=2619396 RepID=UPI00190DD5F8|nr:MULTISPECIES: amidohydrolase [unclassified Blastococcus]MBN1093865.1 amidohydrolase [Blastococcus sp. TML/M2B]MBN1096013.1 amidohydrolase [Blastococcus sp. TML/C7B]
MTPVVEGLGAAVDDWVETHAPQLVAVRRHLHAHPELAYAEVETTSFLEQRLRAAGLSPVRLPTGTGLVVEVGEGPGPTVVLRGDIDALPLPDLKDVPYASTREGVCHACGHDVHTTVVLGVALALQAVGGLPGRVRCVFQPAEETVPGGATQVVASGVLDGASRAFALHCDPSVPAGSVGLRTGAITAACDRIDVTLTGPGGHTARPHLTVDLVDALGRLITELPGLLSRQVDPRAGMSLVWGSVDAGVAANAIPQRGTLRGTVRVLDRDAWQGAEEIIRALVARVAAATGAEVEVDYVRGVPPVVNDPRSVALLRSAALEAVGADGVVLSPQSMGGEDFGWFADVLPIALARLGTHGGGAELDLHRGTFDVDERAIGVGVRLLARAALHALAADAAAPAGSGPPPPARTGRRGPGDTAARRVDEESPRA